MIVEFTNEEIEYLKKIAHKRHEAKDLSFRDSGVLMNTKNMYDPHIIGIIGEAAYGKVIGQEIDHNIYKVRDPNQDFDDIEVKTLTYFGAGEPQLKIKVKEYEIKQPNLYVLTRIDKRNLNRVEILGEITRKKFDLVKKKKRYGEDKPWNYVVDRSQMDSVKKSGVSHIKILKKAYDEIGVKYKEEVIKGYVHLTVVGDSDFRVFDSLGRLVF